MKQKYYWILGIIAVIIIMGIILLNVQKEEGMYVRPDYFRGSLSASDSPLLNQVIEIKILVKPQQFDAPNSMIKFFLPDSVELVSGNIQWNGALQKDGEFEHKISIKTTQTGEFKVRAYVEGIWENGHKEYRSYYLCLITNEDSAEIASTCPSELGLEQKPIEEGTEQTPEQE